MSLALFSDAMGPAPARKRAEEGGSGLGPSTVPGVAALEVGRRFLGADIDPAAITMARSRLEAGK